MVEISLPESFLYRAARESVCVPEGISKGRGQSNSKSRELLSSPNRIQVLMMSLLRESSMMYGDGEA